MRLNTNSVISDADYQNFVTLTDEVEKSVRALFAKNPQILVEVYARTKSRDGIDEKFKRKNYSTLNQMTDVSGIRIVCVSRSEIPYISGLLKSEFSLIREESSTDDLGFDKMGYQDTKIIMSLGSKFAATRLLEIKDKHFEVQIRTIFRNAWAEFSHLLVYKKPEDAPPENKRRVNTMSAVCELLDDAAEQIFVERKAFLENAKSEFDTATPSEKSKTYAHMPLNFDSLTAYTKEKFPNFEVNLSLQAMLLNHLDRSRFTTIDDIDRAVEKASDFLKSYSLEQPTLFNHGTDYLTKALGFTDWAFRQTHGFGKVTREAFDRLGAKKN